MAKGKKTLKEALTFHLVKRTSCGKAAQCPAGAKRHGKEILTFLHAALTLFGLGGAGEGGGGESSRLSQLSRISLIFK